MYIRLYAYVRGKRSTVKIVNVDKIIFYICSISHGKAPIFKKLWCSSINYHKNKKRWN